MSKEARSFCQVNVILLCLFESFLALTRVFRSIFILGRRGRRFIASIVWTTLFFFIGQLSLLAASYKTANFLVHANEPTFAQKVGEEAERYRSELANLWLGQQLPKWSRACEITVKSGVNLPAGGETVFTFSNGEVYDWKMKVQGSEERILDSVLPHEVTHTIIASYLRAPAPRWLDEGMATSVEANSERMRYRKMLVDFLYTNRGIAFNDMIRMKEYPDDLTPFYSQSFSICEYLILVGGRRRLLEFTKEGYDSKDWESALKKYYQCESLGALQLEWVDWVRRWDVANQPIELPDTRKLPEFNLSDDQATMLAHNERLSAPTIPNQRQIANNFDALNGRRPKTALWDNVRDGFGLGQRDVIGEDRLARAQEGSIKNEPRSPFGGFSGSSPLTNLHNYRRDSGTKNVGPSSIQIDTTLERDLNAHDSKTAAANEARGDESKNGGARDNWLANGAGSATRSNNSQNAPVEYYDRYDYQQTNGSRF